MSGPRAIVRSLAGKANRVPRPPGPSTLATLLAARGDPTLALERVTVAYPRLAHLRLGPEHVYVLSDPALVHQLLAARGRSTRKGRSLEKIRLLLGDGLLTSEGASHASQRRLVQPALHGDRIQAYGRIMRDAARETDTRWTHLAPGARVEMTREMSRLTLTVVGRALFGTDLADADLDEVARCLGTLLSRPAWHLLPSADRLVSLPISGYARMLDAVDTLHAVVERLIRERAQAPPDRDLLSYLIRSGMSARQVHDEAVTLLLAGHETTATALSWTWYLLAREPETAAWLRADPERRARAVFAEALRLYPPSWILARRVVEPFELDGCVLPAGSLAVVSPWALHRSGRWWSAPGAFRPTRWLGTDGDFDLEAPGQPRDAYLPFGTGARACVGREFAWAEGTIVLEELCRRWAPALPGGPRGPGVRPLPTITLRPRGGLPMLLRPVASRAPSRARSTDPVGGGS